MSYEDSLKHYRDLHNVMDTAKEEAREEGLKEGMEKGREEGREEEKNKFAKELKADSMDFKVISKYTGLSIEQIEKL